MKRKRRTTAQRVKIFHDANGICHICTHKIDGVREAWEIEHVIPLAMGGDDVDANLKPAHKTCHRDKTDSDVTAIAKAKRVEAKHLGIRSPRTKIVSAQFKSKAPMDKADRIAMKNAEHERKMGLKGK